MALETEPFDAAEHLQSPAAQVPIRVMSQPRPALTMKGRRDGASGELVAVRLRP